LKFLALRAGLALGYQLAHFCGELTLGFGVNFRQLQPKDAIKIEERGKLI
jgi:hypothetical protein